MLVSASGASQSASRILLILVCTPHALKLPTTIARSEGRRLDRPDRPCDANLAMPPLGRQGASFWSANVYQVRRRA